MPHSLEMTKRKTSDGIDEAVTKCETLGGIMDRVKRAKLTAVSLVDLMDLSEGMTFKKISKLLDFEDHRAISMLCKTARRNYTEKPKMYWMKYIEKQKHTNFLFLKRGKPYTTAPLQYYLNLHGWPKCTKCCKKFAFETEKGLPFQPFMKNPLGIYMCANNCGNTAPLAMCGLTLDDISARCLATSRQVENGVKTHSWQDITFDMPNKADSCCSRCGALAITEHSYDEIDQCSYCGVKPVEDCVCETCNNCQLVLDECLCTICIQCDRCKGCENCEISQMPCDCEFCDECGLDLDECECDSMEVF